MIGNWVLPNVSTPGTIQNSDIGDNGYLSTNGNTEAGSAVEEVALVANDDGQLWTVVDKKVRVEEGQHFTLKNKQSGKFLFGHTPNTLTIEGDALFLRVSMYVVGFYHIFLNYRFQ